MSTQVRRLKHSNVNHLVGACVETGQVCLVWGYCHKGSLENVLQHTGIKLDVIFNVSFISDIVRGMTYLHDSPVGRHGRLKSSNVLVDSNWSCRITDIAMPFFREGETCCEVKCKSVFTSELLWTAPELLYDVALQRRGTKKGDVYAFAIIMQEIILRSRPFSIGPDDNARATTLVDQMLHMLSKYADNLEELVEERTTQLEMEQKKTEELLCRMLPKSVAMNLKLGNEVVPESFNAVTIYFSDIVGFTSLAAISTPMQVVDLLNDLYTCFDTIIESFDVYKVETIGDAYMVVSGLPVRNGNLHAGEIATMALKIADSVLTFRIRHLPGEQLNIRIGIHTGMNIGIHTGTSIGIHTGMNIGIHTGTSIGIHTGMNIGIHTGMNIGIHTGMNIGIHTGMNIGIHTGMNIGIHTGRDPSKTLFCDVFNVTCDVSSGPVVAGVVGLKMPRYCLFGDTVNYASRMESTGVGKQRRHVSRDETISILDDGPQRVHVSPECKAYLDVLGGYILQDRGPVEMKEIVSTSSCGPPCGGGSGGGGGSPVGLLPTQTSSHEDDVVGDVCGSRPPPSKRAREGRI
ncbi:hypothetical protein C0Q70_03110 [Pomacea canaliculata]|uniref:Guanylate cyclase n=1 Tax=Pomacea canaliculata TaxID=400727 RepID=A0A2T7PRY5_POMCA|nr:hypothetical protein C0Q70_03110 [Pomacea canaliculata]